MTPRRLHRLHGASPPGGARAARLAPRSRATLAIAAVAGAALLLAGAGDRWALRQHAAAGPTAFVGAPCATNAGNASGAETGSPSSVGLGQWTTFDGAASHGPALAGAGADGLPLTAAWSFGTHGPVVTAPAIVRGVAYFGSMDGCVYAVDVATGRLLWSFAADNQVMSQPLVAEGRVYFGSGDKLMGGASAGQVRGTGPSAVYALDAQTGREVWMFPTAGESMPTPAYSAGVIYEADGAREFYAISAATGGLLWRVSTGTTVSMSSPTVSGDMAVFGGGAPYALVGVDLSTHAVAWTVPLPSAQAGVDDGSPAVADGVAYFQVPEGGRWARRVVEMAVRTSDGRILWQRTLGTDFLNEVQRVLWQGDMGAYNGEEVGVAAVQGGVVYVGSPALHGLWALDARTGQPVWRVPARLGVGVRTAPAVAGGRIYVADNRRLFVVDQADGAVLGSTALGTWRIEPPLLTPCTTPSPVVVGDTLIVGAGTDASALRAIPLAALP